MKGYHLGEFEELILLTVASMEKGAYAVTIKKEFEHSTNRNVNISAIHTALYRLEDKGFLISEFGEASQKRGGKKKRCFSVTNIGIAVLKDSKSIREFLWKMIPQLTSN